MSRYLLVHGGFAGGWFWDDVAPRLEKAGHRVDVVAQLPSSGSGPDPLGDLPADTDHVRAAIEAAGEPVVLVGHSSGGMVLTELADHPGVAHAVYLAALWPRRGQSAMDVIGDGPAVWIVPQEDGTLRVTDDLDLLRRLLCADVEPERAAANLRRHTASSMSSVTAPSTAPERRHPVTYIVCERDQVLAPAVQERLAADADHIERLPSSHQPMFSMPDALADVLDRAR